MSELHARATGSDLQLRASVCVSLNRGREAYCEGDPARARQCILFEHVCTGVCMHHDCGTAFAERESRAIRDRRVSRSDSSELEILTVAQNFPII